MQGKFIRPRRAQLRLNRGADRCLGGGRYVFLTCLDRKSQPLCQKLAENHRALIGKQMIHPDRATARGDKIMLAADFGKGLRARLKRGKHKVIKAQRIDALVRLRPVRALAIAILAAHIFQRIADHGHPFRHQPMRLFQIRGEMPIIFAQIQMLDRCAP